MRKKKLFSGPVFVVGAPRSGTSILTWCLGQHPNLLGLEESNWMSTFATDVAAAFRRGSIRGERSQLGSMGITRDRLMEEMGVAINKSIIGHRTVFIKRRVATSHPSNPGYHPAFQLTRRVSDPKKRWVNGTPEYSFGIYGLRKLFPEARFIHLVRHCDAVVASMLHFRRLAGTNLAETHSQGYQQWERYVRAVLAAEEAYGPEIVTRLFHQDLVAQPEQTIRSALSFLGEDFDAACLEPLTRRINSSEVDADYKIPSESAGDPPIPEARDLWATLTNFPSVADPAGARRLEEQFEERVTYAYTLESCYNSLRQKWRDLEEELAERMNWAQRLDKEIAEKDALITELQATCEERTQWALRLQAELDEKAIVIPELQRLCDERTEWALTLQKQLTTKTAVRDETSKDSS